MPEQHDKIAAVFFDLGDTLGKPTVGGDPPRMVRFEVFPFVNEVLKELRARELRLGVISNTGKEKAPVIRAILEPTGLLALFDMSLLVFSADEGVTKASAVIFDRAAARAGVGPQRCLFVGEDAAERAVARAAAWAVCAHPLLIGGC